MPIAKKSVFELVYIADNKGVSLNEYDIDSVSKQSQHSDIECHYFK
jgi:hypothetical protein